MFDFLVSSITNYFGPPAKDSSAPQFAIYLIGGVVSISCLVQAFPGIVNQNYIEQNDRGEMIVISEGWPAFQTGLLFLLSAFAALAVAKSVCNWIQGPIVTTKDLKQAQDPADRHYL